MKLAANSNTYTFDTLTLFKSRLKAHLFSSVYAS